MALGICSTRPSVRLVKATSMMAAARCSSATRKTDLEAPLAVACRVDRDQF
jgi:hypothetical protein